MIYHSAQDKYRYKLRLVEKQGGASSYAYITASTASKAVDKAYELHGRDKGIYVINWELT